MIKKGDLVKILAGKDSGKTGKVEKVMPKEGRVIVTGINVAKKHQKAKTANTRAGIIDMFVPLNLSNAMLVCPHCNKPTRVGAQITDNRKLRVCKKCKEVIDVIETEKPKKG